MKLRPTITTLFFLMAALSAPVSAQYGEPEIQEIIQPKNLYDEGFRRGFGFKFSLNDFGFGVGTQYRIGISSYNEALINFKIAGLRDPSEQTHIDIYFGNRTIASKYKRVITFPTTIGFKHRLFAEQISDNFRVHTSLSIGPSLAVTLPYFQDYNNNGYREDNFRVGTIGIEPINDIFQGWDEAEWELGWNGEFVLGIDFGDNFARLQTLQFGYSFFYYDQGLQIMEPFAPRENENGEINFGLDDRGLIVYENGMKPSNGAIKYFGSAQITFIIGWMFD